MFDLRRYSKLLFSPNKMVFSASVHWKSGKLKAITVIPYVFNWVAQGLCLKSRALGLTGRMALVHVLAQELTLAVGHFLLICSWCLIQWQLTENRDSVLSFDLSRPLMWAVIDTAALAQTLPTRSGCEQEKQRRLESIPCILISSEMQRSWIKVEKTQQCFR